MFKKIQDIIVGIVIGILIGGTAMYFIRDCDTEDVQVPVIIEVPIEPIDNVFDPIELPVPLPTPPKQKKPINPILKDSLDNVDNVVDSLAIYKKFAVKREYKETFEDSIQTITVNAETTGTLDLLQVDYKTKPRSILLDTTLTVPVPRQVDFFIGGEVIVPDANSLVKATIKPEIGIVNKKRTLEYSIGRDFTNQFTSAGIKWRPKL